MRLHTSLCKLPVSLLYVLILWVQLTSPQQLILCCVKLSDDYAYYFMNWLSCGKKQWWPNTRYCSGICLEGTDTTTKNLRTADIRANIRIRGLPSMRYDCHPLDRNIWSMSSIKLFIYLLTALFIIYLLYLFFIYSAVVRSLPESTSVPDFRGQAPK